MSVYSKDTLSQYNDKKKILIAYHSGSGSTRVICEVLKEKLTTDFNVELHNIYEFDKALLSTFDFIIIGFPTYHCKPSESIIEFVESLSPLKAAKNAIVLSTYGLYSGNSTRILVRELLKKNIITVNHLGIRGPASDGVLMMPPWISFMFNYERFSLTKIKYTVDIVKKFIQIIPLQENVKIPLYKWYVPLNNIARFFGERSYENLKMCISADPDICSNCGLCIRNCGRKCWTSNGSENAVEHKSSTKGPPSFNHQNCEFCLKCVHNCPVRAIKFNDKMSKMPRLNKTFYDNLKKRLLK